MPGWHLVLSCLVRLITPLAGRRPPERRALASPRVGARITRVRFSTKSKYISHIRSSHVRLQSSVDHCQTGAASESLSTAVASLPGLHFLSHLTLPLTYTHPLTHSLLTHSLTHSLPHPPTHSLIHSLTPPPHPLTHSLTHSITPPPAVCDTRMCAMQPAASTPATSRLLQGRWPTCVPGMATLSHMRF
jgi:hypothetical protein